MLREGYKMVFDTLYHNNIPLFIFSAGIGDILEEIIRQMKVFHPNIHIVSSYVHFSEDGFLKGFKGPLIHTYNKNSSVCENSSYFQQLQNKTNIILLGDSIGDLTMADGVLGVQNLLKIGFLKDKVEERWSVTWTLTTLCWRRTRHWTWSMGCCSTSCARGTAWSYRAPKAQAGPCLSHEEVSLPTKPPL